MNTLYSEDGAIKDGAIKDGAIKDGAIKDGAIKDGAIKDGAIKDGAIRSNTRCVRHACIHISDTRIYVHTSTPAVGAMTAPLCPKSAAGSQFPRSLPPSPSSLSSPHSRTPAGATARRKRRGLSIYAIRVYN